MKSKSFCELIGCRIRDTYRLDGYHCVCPRSNAVFPCTYLNLDGKIRIDPFPNDPRSEIQILSALIKSKNGK